MIRQVTPEILQQLLEYCPKTGKLYWRYRLPAMFPEGSRSAEDSARLFNARFCGREAFTASQSKGYRCGGVFGQIFLAHRVIWAIYHGVWPANSIDHINGDCSDNRIENLRDVSVAENQRNMKIHKSNSSGVSGVHWSKNNKGWVARIYHENRLRCLGTFKDKQDAIYARKSAERRFGYHPNHGRAS